MCLQKTFDEKVDMFSWKIKHHVKTILYCYRMKLGGSWTFYRKQIKA